MMRKQGGAPTAHACAVGCHSELSALIRTCRNRWRAMTAMRASSLAAAAAALVLALAFAAHRLVAPDGGALIALWVTALVGAVACLVWFIIPSRRGPSTQQVARFIEERCPELEDALVTAVAQDVVSESSPMASVVVDDAVRRTRGLDIDRVISRAALRQVALRAAGATLALAFAVGISAVPAIRAARVAAAYLFPGTLALQVEPGDVKVRAGDPLRIVARIPGAVAGVVPVLRVGGGNEWREARMEPSGDGFAAAFQRIEQGFRYAVIAAGASSRQFTVTVIRPPRVERIDLRYEYPSAFGMQPREEEDGGDIYGPAGTKVRLAVHADKPVTDAALTLAGGQRITLKPRGDALEGELTISEDGSYRVALADADGLSNPGATEYFIRTLEDRPPDVRIVRPASDRQVTPIEEVSIEARADDDFGIAALDLVYAVRGGSEKTVPFRRDASGTTVNGQRMIYLEDLGVQPGDFVTYYARARDVSRGKRSTEARSDIFFLEVTPFEEEFVASQGQGAGGSNDRGLEEMVQAQKDIITATWKLDTRARQAGGRSEEDIRTVAKAQRDLRSRAAAAAVQMQRANNLRRARPGAGRSAQAPADVTADAMAKAADAMGKAEQQLEALKTTDALPHEMAALNELLRAQAENRRREVQQQQANGTGGRGSNRQQQDLSSLFDRELARQQTNYETPNSRETRQENTENNDALEKIRELARRQDALNRQQQEAAKNQKGTPDEELRRQLEKLTREQSELRRQAEELARELQQSQQQNQQGQGQQGAQGRQGRQGGQGTQSRQQAGRDLQQVSEDMQGAASELRRENPRQASERGSRAAERLRDLEQRMRSAQPDDRRRALGELQLESREIADAERRLANESSSGRGNPNDDAARRRAAEQERLADRTDRLENSVRQLADAKSGDERERSALAEAARELDRQQLPDRMRNAARAERQSAEGRQNQPPNGKGQAAGQNGQPQQQAATGREQQQIANELDRLAERLGSAGGQSAESQRLSDELSRIRELREKLTELDRQLAEMREHPTGRGEPQNGRGGRRGDAPQNGNSDQPWQDARELLEQLRSERGGEIESPNDGGFNPGRSAPGTEAWKQDFAKWDDLKVQIAAALERAEAGAASRLRDEQSTDRLNAGATQAVPEQYRRLVDRYYRALASKSPEKK